MAKNRNTNDARQKRPKKQLTIVEGPRVRYAPAPTGPLHVGGARTVLFNWLFARKYGGSFIIRIEDTDVERSDPKFEKDILDSIRWLGLDWDEGPDIGGSYGPYRQSERLTIYAKYIKKLLDEDKAYRCFCSEEDLKAERQEMLSRGVPPKYSGRCKTLSKEEVEKNLKDGKFFLVRIKMPAKIVEVEDLIRGKVRFDTNLIGDIAISKKEDIPLYNFAAVVDDYEMKISHVIRGEDHLSNTPKQIVLQELLGFAHPEYAHLPLILGPDRTKLSKRHGAVGISEYRKLGYLPEALINFLSLLGWHVAGDREIFSKEDLIREFTLDRVQKAGAV
ncbi:MAG: glutamate--tRNA ligase, partial [Candidatus Paceibacteria bacterium]